MIAILLHGRERAAEVCCTWPGRAFHDAKVEGVVVVLDDTTPIGDEELSLLAAEGWREPVVVQPPPETEGRRDVAAAPKSAVSFAQRRWRRILQALSALNNAVTTNRDQADAELTRALDGSSGDPRHSGPLWNYASAMRWVDQNVY